MKANFYHHNEDYKKFLGSTIMKTFNESLVYLKSNLEEMIGQ